MEDIDKVLAYEIKKEVADRYFSFRRIIEQDSTDYLASIVQTSAELEAGIGLDLVRIFILLRDEPFIREFQDLANLPREPFYDPYICTSPTLRMKVFKGFRVRGLSRKKRYLHLICDLYRRLHMATIPYHKALDRLNEQHETIEEQIRLFYRKNDLHGILSFIRSLDRSEHAAILEGDPSNGYHESLEQKMRITPPLPVEHLLPVLPVIPPFNGIKKQFLDLASRAFRAQPGIEVRTFCS